MIESAKPHDAPQVKVEECTVSYKIGDVVISMKAVLAEPESGYLCLPVIGTKVIILHVGINGDENGWLYVGIYGNENGESTS